MDLTNEAVVLKSELGVDVPGRADITNWFPPGTTRPAGTPVWSAVVIAAIDLPDLMPVGTGGDMFLDDSGAHASYAVVAVYDRTAEIRGRSWIMPAVPA